VEYESITRRVALLRDELQKIGVENREYLQHKNHREYETIQHQHRQERISEIKLELEKMLKIIPGRSA
jgi:hypothetical protein